MGVGEPWMPDVVAPKVHQNNRSYNVCELSGPTFGFTMQEFSMVGSYTETLKTTKLSKLGGGHLRMGTCVWALARDNTVCILLNQDI